MVSETTENIQKFTPFSYQSSITTYSFNENTKYIQPAMKSRKNIYEGRLNVMKICFQCYQKRPRKIFSNETARIQEF